jgi:hypothetical protein
MYKVTIQATPISKIDWKVVAAGHWTPGQPPELAEQGLAAELLEELFTVTPQPSEQSCRNQIRCGDTLYAVVFRRLLRWP